MGGYVLSLPDLFELRPVIGDADGAGSWGLRESVAQF
jgi:hypothetical protein